MKAALHLHSTYSDGSFTLPELRKVLKAAGCSLAFVTDHAEALDVAKLEAYVSECAALSDATFRFVPGLEFECDGRMHMLGYGVTTRTDSRNPEDVSAHIERLGGVSVIAHPKPDHYDWIETFAVLPMGIEVWNSKYHGRYAPRPDTFALLQRLQRRRPEMHAFYGQDLHWRKQYRKLFTEVHRPSNEAASAIAALRTGEFHGVKDSLELSSSGDIPAETLAHFATVNARSSRLRSVLGAAKRLVSGMGLSVPKPIKDQLRRIF